MEWDQQVSIPIFHRLRHTNISCNSRDTHDIDMFVQCTKALVCNHVCTWHVICRARYSGLVHEYERNVFVFMKVNVSSQARL